MYSYIPELVHYIVYCKYDSQDYLRIYWYIHIVRVLEYLFGNGRLEQREALGDAVNDLICALRVL